MLCYVKRPRQVCVMIYYYQLIPLTTLGDAVDVTRRLLCHVHDNHVWLDTMSRHLETVWWHIIFVLFSYFFMLKSICLMFLISTYDITICLCQVHYIHIWHKLCLCHHSDDHVWHYTMCHLPDDVCHCAIFASFPWQPKWCYTILGHLLDNHVWNYTTSHRVSDNGGNYMLCVHIFLIILYDALLWVVSWQSCVMLWVSVPSGPPGTMLQCVCGQHM